MIGDKGSTSSRSQSQNATYRNPAQHPNTQAVGSLDVPAPRMPHACPRTGQPLSTRFSLPSPAPMFRLEEPDQSQFCEVLCIITVLFWTNSFGYQIWPRWKHSLCKHIENLHSSIMLRETLPESPKKGLTNLETSPCNIETTQQEIRTYEWIKLEMPERLNSYFQKLVATNSKAMRKVWTWTLDLKSS